MSVRFVPAQDIQPSAWNEVVDSSDEAWLFHRAEWLAAENELSDQRGFGVVEGGELVGVCPVVEYERASPVLRLRSVASGAHFPSGPAYRRELPEARRAAIDRAVFEHLRRISAHADQVVVRLPPLAPRWRSTAVNPLLLHGFMPHCLYGSARNWGHAPVARVMDLEGGRGAWLATASSRCRSQVRAAERAGAREETIGYLEGWQRFRKLQQATYRRTRALGWPESFFVRLQPLAEQMTFHFAISPDGDEVGLWVVRHGDGAHYLASGRSSERGEAGLGAFVQYAAMEIALRRGCRHYHLGPYFPFMSPRDKLGRIGEFKRRIGGRDAPMHEGTALLSPVKVQLSLALEQIAERLVAVARRR